MSRSKLYLVSVVGLLLAVCGATAVSQGRQKDDSPYSDRFWNYLQKQNYQEKWSQWPGHEAFTEGTSPHGALLKVYINDKATGNTDSPPPGSIIVKENYDKDKKLLAITPMFRATHDYDPEHNNWWWAKYKPDGTVFEQDGMKLSGKLKGCIQCHSSAKGDDYIFTND